MFLSFRYECGINRLLIESGLNLYSFLVVRLLSRVGLDSLCAMRGDLEERSETRGCEPGDDQIYRGVRQDLNLKFN